MFVDNLEKVLHTIFITALREFASDTETKSGKDGSKNEKLLNRRLFRELNGAAKVGTFLIECPVQPSGDDESPLSREEKKPDITLRLVDYETREHLDYHIECKRLDRPPSHYCSAYIIKGVARFIDARYGYGCFSDLGFMIGYIQGLTFDKAFEAVNSYAVENNIPPLELLNGESEMSLSTLEHILDRQQKFPGFRLRHYWTKL